MKTYLGILLLMVFVASGRAQFYVVSVHETVLANGKPLKKQDKLELNTELKFPSKTAYAKVMSPGKGYFILGVDKKDTRNGEFVRALKDALMPPNDHYAAATRTDETFEAANFEDRYDLMAFFTDRLFFIEPAIFTVPENDFPLTDEKKQYFAVRHHLEDGNFEKKLPANGPSFQIDPSVFRLEGHAFNPDIVLYSELYYYNGSKADKIGQFNLLFPDPAAIQDEIKTLSLHEDAGKTSADRFFEEYAVPYLYQYYGKTQPGAIRKLVSMLKE